jgi:membrane protease subunit (stomatin/prohibitin family)
MLYPEYREYKSLCDQVCQYVSAGQRGVLVSNTDGQNVNLGDVLSKLGAQLAGGLSGTAGTMNQVQSNSNLTAPANTWKCHCGHENTGNFCSGCGSTKSAQITDLQDEWKCFCGTVNKGRFCSNCGNKQFTLEDIECSECSWKAESGLTVVPAFCPNCGKRFDKNDLQ